MTNYKDHLAKIMPHVELDKELHRKDLEKENAYLLIQVNKYKKELLKNSPRKKDSHPNEHIEKLIASQKRKMDNLKKELITRQNAATKYRELMNKHAKREQFVIDQVKKRYGVQAYIDIMNHVDNPDRGARFTDPERKKKFLEKNRIND